MDPPLQLFRVGVPRIIRVCNAKKRIYPGVAVHAELMKKAQRPPRAARYNGNVCRPKPPWNEAVLPVDNRRIGFHHP